MILRQHCAMHNPTHKLRALTLSSVAQRSEQTGQLHNLGMQLIQYVSFHILNL